MLLITASVLIDARSGDLDDPIVGPDSHGVGSAADPAPRWLQVGRLALFPALTLGFILLDLVVTAIAGR